VKEVEDVKEVKDKNFCWALADSRYPGFPSLP